MKISEKKCPRCAEAIKREALVCKHCGHQFDPAQVQAQNKKDVKAAGIGCLAIIVIFGVIAIAGGGGGSTGNSSDAATEQSAAQKVADDRRKGFHCLSAWDGSLRGLVDSVKKSLRNPDSFQHVETKITPVDDKGYHMLLMEYRAQNGFGGMIVGKVAARVKSEDCSFTVIANTDE